MPTLSVVIVTHNSAGAIAPTMLALSSQLREGDELIVVDNASADATAELVLTVRGVGYKLADA